MLLIQLHWWTLFRLTDCAKRLHLIGSWLACHFLLQGVFFTLLIILKQTVSDFLLFGRILQFKRVEPWWTSRLQLYKDTSTIDSILADLSHRGLLYYILRGQWSPPRGSLAYTTTSMQNTVIFTLCKSN